MPRFRKKPVEIEAIQWTGKNVKEVTAWLKEHAPRVYEQHADEPCRVQFEVFRDQPSIVKIRTLENKKGDAMLTQPTDWIIRGIKGELYPCTDEIFKATYDPLEP